MAMMEVDEWVIFLQTEKGPQISNALSMELSAEHIVFTHSTLSYFGSQALQMVSVMLEEKNKNNGGHKAL